MVTPPIDRSVFRDDGRWVGSRLMQTNLDAAVNRYLLSKTLSRGIRNEYISTIRKWEQWGCGVPIEEIQRKDIREFLDWVYERRTDREQSPRAPPRSPLVGVGAGGDRHPATLPQAMGAARCGGSTLLDESRDQRPLLRDAPDEETPWLG